MVTEMCAEMTGQLQHTTEIYSKSQRSTSYPYPGSPRILPHLEFGYFLCMGAMKLHRNCKQHLHSENAEGVYFKASSTK